MIERRFRHTSTRGSVAPRRTSDRRFTGDCIHSSLLRRGATEPPDSHSPPLHVLHVLHGQTSLRTPRLCASALKHLHALHGSNQRTPSGQPSRMALAAPTSGTTPPPICRRRRLNPSQRPLQFLPVDDIRHAVHVPQLARSRTTSIRATWNTPFASLASGTRCSRFMCFFLSGFLPQKGLILLLIMAATM